MKIAILNECFFDQDTLKRLRQIGDVQVALDTDNEEKAIKRIQDAEVIIADMFVCPLTPEVLDHAPDLKLIAINSTAFDRLDMEYLNKRGILLANTPGFSTDSVAEQVFALIFALARKTVVAAHDFKKEPFEILPDVAEHRKYLGFNLRGKTLGVIGTGSIGGRVCEIAQAFGMNVLGYNPSPKDIDGVTFTSLEDLVSRSDIISINAPLNDSSRGMFDEVMFKKMKDSAILVTTSNEHILDLDALVDALENRQLGGVAFDHMMIKDTSHPLLTRNDVLCLPMCGWYTQESLDNIAEIITQAVEAFAEEKRKYIVN